MSLQMSFSCLCKLLMVSSCLKPLKKLSKVHLVMWCDMHANGRQRAMKPQGGIVAK